MRTLITRRRITLFAALLAGAVGVQASISAIPTDSPIIDMKAERRADDPSQLSVWDRPVASSPVVTVRPVGPPPTAPERASSPNPLWEIPIRSLSNTRERPVFSPSRRPPPPAVVVVPPPREAPSPPKPPRVERPELSLVGTIAGDEESFGIFIEESTRTALRLRLGEDYQGWTLRAVLGREVTLEHDQQTATLTLPQPGTFVPGQLQAKVDAGAPGPTATQQRDQRR